MGETNAKAVVKVDGDSLVAVYRSGGTVLFRRVRRWCDACGEQGQSAVFLATSCHDAHICDDCLSLAGVAPDG